MSFGSLQCPFLYETKKWKSTFPQIRGLECAYLNLWQLHLPITRIIIDHVCMLSIYIFYILHYIEDHFVAQTRILVTSAGAVVSKWFWLKTLVKQSCQFFSNYIRHYLTSIQYHRSMCNEWVWMFWHGIAPAHTCGCTYELSWQSGWIGRKKYWQVRHAWLVMPTACFLSRQCNLQSLDLIWLFQIHIVQNYPWMMQLSISSPGTTLLLMKRPL